MVSFGSKAMAIAAAVILAGAGAVAFSQAGADGVDKGPQRAAEPHIYDMEALDAFDVSDERKLVGFADNVFVGRVKDEVGIEPITGAIQPDADGPEGPTPSIPQTQFSVEVLDNVKGQLDGVVIVSQTGGRVPGENAVSLLERDPLLRSGETVLFATRFVSGEGWHQITTANYADIRLGGPEERARLVKRFENAKSDQIDPLATRRR